MNPEFIIWLNEILEWLGYALCVTLAVFVVLGVIAFVYCAVKMQKAERK